jgi:DNA processing protein
MHTVDEAERRQRPVMAVPGPVRSPASAGTNQLVADGALVVRDVRDVLVELGLAGPPATAAEHRPAPSPAHRAVLDALGWQPATYEQLVVRTGDDPGALSLALQHLERDGWVDNRNGWYERVAKPGPGGDR